MTGTTHGLLSANRIINGVLTDGWKWTGTSAPDGALTYFFDVQTIAGASTRIWDSTEQAAYRNALFAWSNVAQIAFVEAPDRNHANFNEMLVNNAQALSLHAGGFVGLHYGPDTDTHLGLRGYYNYQGQGTLPVGQATWSSSEYQPGGYFEQAMVHEIGHALGLKHPFDAVGSAPILAGSLDHEFSTVMSYNSNYSFDGFGHVVNSTGNPTLAGSAKLLDYGYVMGPMALDIAAVQFLYGADTTYNFGNDVYLLPDANVSGTGWRCIWDTGGTDTLRYIGVKNAVLDLTAATLDDSSSGGGELSYATNVYGGYTIAHGVIIENAIGGSGNDIINGNAARNVLSGGAGNDALYGLAGADTLDGGAGADVAAGGAGDDRYYVDSVSDVVVEQPSAGHDAVIAKVNFVMPTNVEVLILSDGPLDFLARNATGGSGADDIRGNQFDNIIDGKGGADVMRGGIGNDTYYVDNSFDVVSENPGEGTDTVFSSLNNYTLGHDIENLRLIGGAFAGTGNERNNSIFGNEFSNVLSGGLGLDRLEGGKGDDVYVLADVTPVVIGQDGETDLFYDVVVETAGRGTDTVVVGLQVGNIGYVLGANIENGLVSGSGKFSLTGNSLSNILTGNGAANTLIGGAGGDFLDGGGGVDTMSGGLDSDGYAVDNIADSVIEVARGGTDVVYTTVSFALGAGQEIEVLTATDIAATTAMSLTGNAYINLIRGNAGDNILNGGGGSDTMMGLGGNDYYYVDDADDNVVEAIGQGSDRVVTSTSYTLRAGQSIELFTPSVAAATTAINLAGNELAQTINGNAGANVINGRGGNDTLTGLGGSDTFRFDSALGRGNLDRITDFAHGTDKIALENAIFTRLPALGSLAASAFFSGTAAHDADDRIIYNPTTGALIYDNNGNATSGAIQFATLAPHLGLTSSDFIVV